MVGRKELINVFRLRVERHFRGFRERNVFQIVVVRRKDLNAPRPPRNHEKLAALAGAVHQVGVPVVKVDVETLGFEHVAAAPANAAEVLLRAVLLQVAQRQLTPVHVVRRLLGDHVQVDGHLGWEDPDVWRDAVALHLVLELGIQDVQTLVALLNDRPGVALVLHVIARSLSQTVVLSPPLRVVLARSQEGVHDAEVGGRVHRVRDLLQVQHEVLATALGGHEPVLDDEGETSAKEVVGATLRFGGDEARNALLGLDVHQRAVEAEDLPLDVNVVGVKPRQ